MISKKQFVGYIEKLKELSVVEENINKAFRGLDTDFNLISFGNYTSLITKILHDVFDDQYDNLGYFLYELDYGKKWKKGKVSYKNGEDIPMGTAEDLYDYMVKEMKSKEKDNAKQGIAKQNM